jgi:hypothetical protein
VRHFLRNEPFRPFEIHCGSGEVFRVEHPEDAAVVGTRVVVPLADGQNAIMISLLQIVGVNGAQNCLKSKE